MATSLDKSENGERKTLQSYMAQPTADDASLVETLKFYCSAFDLRYEDLGKHGTSGFCKVIVRDCMAGLVVAMVAIPMAMGFAVASGLRPEQGIVGGAIAGLIGALLGGSKYQVYGPTAVFIPVMHGIMALHMKGGALYVEGLDEEEMFRRGHGLLVLISLVAAVMLLCLSVARVGWLVAKVPNCILVGFTIGIGFTVAFGFLEEALGLPDFHSHFLTSLGLPDSEEIQKVNITNHMTNPHIPGDALWPKIDYVQKQAEHINPYALVLAVGTLVCMGVIAKISVFMPAPLMAVVCSTVLAQTVWKDKGLRNVFDSYGHIPQNITFTPPALHAGDAPAYEVAGIILYYAIVIMFVGAVESLLCSRMADTLAENTGTPFQPNKELWAQGCVNAVVPLLNGFPHNGALARTALNIKLGAVTPLAGIMKCIFKLLMCFTFTRYLEMMPMASIAGLLWYVALNMISPMQIVAVWEDGGWSHLAVTIVTAILVVTTDIVHGIASGMIVYAMGYYLVEQEVLPEIVSGRKSSRKNTATQEEIEPLLSPPSSGPLLV